TVITAQSRSGSAILIWSCARGDSIALRKAILPKASRTRNQTPIRNNSNPLSQGYKAHKGSGERRDLCSPLCALLFCPGAGRCSWAQEWALKNAGGICEKKSHDTDSVSWESSRRRREVNVRNRKEPANDECSI